jgi:hypothetical protein
MIEGLPQGVREGVRAIGRVDDRDPRCLRFAWSGAGFAARFRGRSLRARIGGSAAWLRIELDGVVRVEEVGPSREWLEIGQDLSEGEHLAVVRKRTEPLVGELFLRDLETDGRILSAREPAGPRIEFLGDSITCGYGNLAPDASHGFEASTEDWFGSYAGVVERLLGASTHCLAWSGLGIVRNFDPGPIPTMSDRCGQANPVSGAAWDHARWVPDVVVVNLGSNDLFRAPHPEKRMFRDAWIALVRRTLSRSPTVKAVLLDGPLLKDGFPIDESGRPIESLSFLRACLDEVAAGFDPRRVFRFSLTPAPGACGWGADWHPSLAQHELNGRELAGFLRAEVLRGAGPTGRIPAMPSGRAELPR